MNIENEFHVPLAPHDAWAVVTDVTRVAPCFPGARLNKAISNDAYQGEVQFKLGPVQVNFAGKLEFKKRDTEKLTATLRARGKEQRGRGAADADIALRVIESDGGSTVFLDTDLKLAGAVAQYGRGAGVIKGVAEQILQEFARNLEAEIKGTRDSVDAPPIAGVSVVGRAVASAVKGRLRGDNFGDKD